MARTAGSGRAPRGWAQRMAKRRRRPVEGLVIYESMYGNTAHVAEAIVRGLREQAIGTTGSRHVDDVAPRDVNDTDLLVVGGPTHVHGMSRESTASALATTRRTPTRQPTDGPGLRDWLDRLPDGHPRRRGVRHAGRRLPVCSPVRPPRRSSAISAGAGTSSWCPARASWSTRRTVWPPESSTGRSHGEPPIAIEFAAHPVGA